MSCSTVSLPPSVYPPSGPPTCSQNDVFLRPSSALGWSPGGKNHLIRNLGCKHEHGRPATRRRVGMFRAYLASLRWQACACWCRRRRRSGRRSVGRRGFRSSHWRQECGQSVLSKLRGGRIYGTTFELVLGKNVVNATAPTTPPMARLRGRNAPDILVYVSATGWGYSGSICCWMRTWRVGSNVLLLAN